MPMYPISKDDNRSIEDLASFVEGMRERGLRVRRLKLTGVHYDWFVALMGGERPGYAIYFRGIPVTRVN